MICVLVRVSDAPRLPIRPHFAVLQTSKDAMQRELSELWDNVRELNRMDAVKEAALQQVPRVCPSTYTRSSPYLAPI